MQIFGTKKKKSVCRIEVVKTLNLNVDASIVRRRGIENDLMNYRLAKKPTLTKNIWHKVFHTLQLDHK